MVIRIDLVKILAVLILGAAAWLGEMAWWIPPMVLCYFTTLPWTWISPAMRREAEREIAIQQAMALPHPHHQHGNGSRRDN